MNGFPRYDIGLILDEIRETRFTHSAEPFVRPILTRVLTLHSMPLLRRVSCLQNSVRFPPVLLVQLASPTATVYSSVIKTVHCTEKCYILN